MPPTPNSKTYQKPREGIKWALCTSWLKDNPALREGGFKLTFEILISILQRGKAAPAEGSLTGAVLRFQLPPPGAAGVGPQLPRGWLQALRPQPLCLSTMHP